MGKYKVGDEVLAKVRMVGDRSYGYALETYDDLFFTAKKDQVIPVPDMTAEEAWEIALRLYELSDETLTEIFGHVSSYIIMQDFSPKEAKEKIKAWEASKNINVGDVVECNNYSCVVTNIDKNEIDVLLKNGSCRVLTIETVKKTGRHIDIKVILNQIGGTDA